MGTKSKRVIVIVSAGGTVYELDKDFDGFVIKEITFRRDGYSGIYKPSQDESHYVIGLVNSLVDKDMVHKIIPISKVDSITYIIVEDEESKTETSSMTKAE